MNAAKATTTAPTGIVERLRECHARWLERCSRVTSGGEVLREIDGLRFVAITTVVLFHLDLQAWNEEGPALRPDAFSSGVHWLFSKLSYGVPIFFSISGFILMLPFARACRNKTAGKIHLKTYYVRRVTRIEPPYVINLLVQFAVKSVHHAGLALVFLPHLLASLFYVHNRVYGEPSTINPVAWSLEVEVQFYLLAPLIARLFLLNKAARRSILVLTALSAPITADRFGLSRTLLDSWQYFVAGIIIADVYSERQSVPGVSGICDALALAALGGIFLIGSGALGITMPAVELVVNLAFLAGALYGGWFRKFLQVRTIAVVGGMCYTIYLWHDYILTAIRHVVSHVKVGPSYWSCIAFQSLIVFPLTVLVCSALFIMLEKPFMYKDWPKKLSQFLGGRFGAQPAPVAANSKLP